MPVWWPLMADMEKWFDAAGFVSLPISLGHAKKSGSYTQSHRDPFDRMLAAQRTFEAAPLISRDDAIDAFGVDRIWA